MKHLFILFCVLFSFVANGGIYKRILADGSVVYTDKPGPNAELVKLSNLSSNIITTSTSASPPKPLRQSTPPPPARVYKLTIQTPEPETTIRDNSGKLIVSGRMDPSGAGQFELLMNGNVAATSNRPHFQLENVPRGAYKLQLYFRNNKGKLIASSPIHQVYLHRASVLNRAN